jgi:hypothetical protein
VSRDGGATGVLGDDDDQVSSPATVPSTSAQPGAVEGRAHDVGGARRRAEDDEVARVVHLHHPVAEDPAQVVLRRALLGRELRDGVDGRRHPATRTLMAPRSSRSRETVACVALDALGAEELDEVGLAGDRRSERSLAMRCCR